MVSLRFGKEEYLFEVHRKAVANGRRDAGRFVPDDLVAQYPTAQDHLVGELVRNIAKRV